MIASSTGVDGEYDWNMLHMSLSYKNIAAWAMNTLTRGEY
jgi:hypothetical protein